MQNTESTALWSKSLWALSSRLYSFKEKNTNISSKVTWHALRRRLSTEAASLPRTPGLVTIYLLFSPTPQLRQDTRPLCDWCILFSFSIHFVQPRTTGRWTGSQTLELGPGMQGPILLLSASLPGVQKLCLSYTNLRSALSLKPSIPEPSDHELRFYLHICITL